MNSIKYVAGAFAAGALAFGALSGGDFAMSKGKRSGGGPAFRVDRHTDDAHPAPAQQSSTPIATAEGSEIDTTAALMQVRRTGAKGRDGPVSAPNAGAERQPGSACFPAAAGGDGSWYRAVGPAPRSTRPTAASTFPLVDADGSMPVLHLTSEALEHRARPAGVYGEVPGAAQPTWTRVSIHVPGFQSFDGVALGR